MVGSMEDLGAKIEGRRRFGELGICEDSLSLLFESCVDVIAMMTLKRVVTFHL